MRLKRHYDLCIKGYERAAFKDLAHILRVWVDMRGNVDTYLTINRPLSKFISYALLSKIVRLLRDDQYLVTYFHNRIKVSIHPDVLLGKLTNEIKSTSLITGKIPKGLLSNGESDFSVLNVPTYAKALQPALFEIGFVGGSTFSTSGLILSNVNIDFGLLGGGSMNECFEIRKVKFGAWLDSIAFYSKIYNNKNELEKYDIPRGIMIQRIANVLGASHPEGGMEISNRYDFCVKSLMEYSMYQVPIPYLILLKTAHDILEQFDYLR